jgi:hypothetical protein
VFISFSQGIKINGVDSSGGHNIGEGPGVENILDGQGEKEGEDQNTGDQQTQIDYIKIAGGFFSGEVPGGMKKGGTNNQKKYDQGHMVIMPFYYSLSDDSFQWSQARHSRPASSAG